MRVVAVCALGLGAMLGACERNEGLDAGVAELPSAAEFRSSRVDGMLEAVSRVLRTRGFSGESEPWRGFLVERSTDVRPIAMRTGSCYVVAAVGSAALRELELRVYDGDGAEVAREGEQGPVAALRFCPPHNATYYVAARSVVGSGLYSAREFRGPTGLALRIEDVLGAVAQPSSERDPG